MGKGKLGARDKQIHTTIYKINNKDLLYSTGNYIQYLVIIRERARWWRKRWTWNTSLSTDTSGIHLQTEKSVQNTS